MPQWRPGWTILVVLSGLLSWEGKPAYGDEAFITDQQGNAVTVVDLNTDSVVATIVVEGHPAGIAISQDGSAAYVTSPDAHILSVIDTAGRRITRQIMLGGEPLGVASSAAGLVYVADWISTRILVIDPVAGRVLGEIAVGRSPSGLAVSSDGSLLVCADRLDNQLTLVSLPDDRVVGTVAVGQHPFGVALDGHGRAFVADVDSQDVSVVDLVSQRLIGTVPTGPRPYVVALSKDHGFVTNELGGSVTVFDLQTLATLSTIDVGAYPEGIQIDRRGRMYVVNWMDDTVSVVGENSLSASKNIKVGLSPRAFGTFIRNIPSP